VVSVSAVWLPPGARLLVAGLAPHKPTRIFCSLLKSLHDHSVKDKEANFLMSPAIFDPNHPNREGKKRRGLKNIRYLRHIWFDFENGELQPDELAALFPFEKMIIFNTYNHTAEAPRFRAILPTSQRLTSEAYEAVWDNFAAKLRMRVIP
jgi:hypothetical protein